MSVPGAMAPTAQCTHEFALPAAQTELFHLKGLLGDVGCEFRSQLALPEQLFFGCVSDGGFGY